MGESVGKYFNDSVRLTGDQYWPSCVCFKCENPFRREQGNNETREE